MTNLVNIYLVYRILRLFTTPWTEWEAFKTGVIDAEGNIIVPQEKRTQEQDDSFSKFELLILKLKRVLEKLPFGKTRLASYGAALFLLKEQNNLTEENIEELFTAHYSTSEFLYEAYEAHRMEEDSPANSDGGGNIAGLRGDPPMGKGAQAAFLRRFGKNDVFVVKSDVYRNARMGKKKYTKYENYVGNDEVGNAIREYGRKYPKRPIIVQDEDTGAMTFLRYGRRGLFTEQFKKE